MTWSLQGVTLASSTRSDTPGTQQPDVLGMTAPYTFLLAIMPLADCAVLARHLISSTAQLEAWSSKRHRIGGAVQLGTMMQAYGARWVRGV